MSNVLIPKYEVNGVTTRGGKITSKPAPSKEINENGINKNEPPRFEQDMEEKPHDVGVKNKSSSIHERTTRPLVKVQQLFIPFQTGDNERKVLSCLVNELSLKEKDTRSFTIPCQVLEKHKEVEDLATDHLSRFENPHTKVLAEREIADKFSDEHLMVLKSKFNNDEPWYADFVNYIVVKVVPPNWTFEKRKRLFASQDLLLVEPYAFKLCADNIMKRCMAGSETVDILAHSHSGPTGGHHSALVTGKKVYESRLYWPSFFKDANEYIRRRDACQRS
nr:reverse transcriptase domain-containing protein [Tanacetum cinerariifolium]